MPTEPLTGGLDPLGSIAAGQTQDPEAGAKALFGVRPVAEDDVDQDPGSRTDTGGPVAQLLGRGLGITAMAGRTMVVQRRCARVARGGAPVAGHTLAGAEDLDGGALWSFLH